MGQQKPKPPTAVGQSQGLEGEGKQTHTQTIQHISGAIINLSCSCESCLVTFLSACQTESTRLPLSLTQEMWLYLEAW